MNTYTIALVQMAMTPDSAANMTAALKLAREAAQRAQVVCLPELYRSRYFCQREDPRAFELAEPIPGPSSEQFGALARETGSVMVVPVFERRAPGLYHNSAVVFDADGRMVGIYRKMHIPDDPGFYEKYYFRPGDLGFRVFDTRVGRLAILICWDQWFPEAARLAALRGAEIIFYPTAIGWLPGEKGAAGEIYRDAWITAQRAHAICNGVYVAAVNRVGHEDVEGAEGIEFWGSSFVTDPQGIVVARGSTNHQEIIYAEVRKDIIEQTRRTWPFLRDRRTDAYGDLGYTFCDVPPRDASSEGFQP